ncbi:hypothetical protein [Halosimplex sp. J119]
MSFTFRFTLPYEVASPESRLDRAMDAAAQNVSAESDVSGYTGSDREYSGNVVTWTLNGIDAADLSQETRQAIMDAIEAEMPGAAEFEIVE